MNAYTRKQETRRARLEAAADRAEARSAAAYAKADLSEAATGIPLGQPILVGHHSERRHRATIARADSAMRRSIEEDKRAGELRAKAASVGTAGISSDDPEAADKLRAKIAELEASRDMMRGANKVMRKHLRRCPELGEQRAEAEGFAAFLEELRGVHAEVTAAGAAAMLEPDFCGRRGFADYQMSNTGAEVRRLKKRLEALEARADQDSSETERAGVRLVENVEDNRLQLIFPGKPSAETRAALKSGGFRWAPSAGAWQRQLTNAARYAAERVLREFEAAT